MAIDLGARKAYQPNDPDLSPILGKLQGNILKGHGRNHTRNLFLRFTASAEAAREVLSRELPRRITSARQQQEDTARFKVIQERGSDVDEPGTLFANFFLSRKGYVALGFSDDQIRQALPEPSDSEEKYFFDGMLASQDRLSDPDPERWDEKYRQDIHALLLLAHDSESDLDDAEQTLERALADIASVVVREKGQAYRDKAGRAFEHFGFADGISQPAFFADDAKGSNPQTWDPLAPLGLVLVRDGLVNDDDEAFGSYYVFRKLQQDVKAFHRRERSLARSLQLPGLTPERVGAMAVGRFPDGTPLVLAQGANQNDFNFRDDRLGAGCPLHAHIRKVNPRGTIAEVTATTEETVEHVHRIVRRAIPYGKRSAPAGGAFDPVDLPPEGVGLLFACFQANIAKQFAFIQSWWCNRADHPPGAGVDPLIGALHGSVQHRWGPNQKDRADFGQFVRFLGGEFFFTPSIPFFARLATPQQQ